MTVGELRKLLEVFPQDAEIVFDPDGVWEPQSIEQVSRRLMVVHLVDGSRYFVAPDARVVGKFSEPREVVCLGS